MANEKIVNRENLKAFRQANDERYKSGQVVVGQAKTIKAVSDESGTTQETPFILQGTGTANNTDIVDTSPIGKHVEKQGNTVAVNQLVDHYTNRTTGGLVFTDNNNGTVSVSGLANQDNDWTFLTIPKTKLKANHKYLLYSNAKNQLVYVVNGNTYQPSGNRAIYTYTSTALDIGANYLVSNGTNYNETFCVNCVDLTQWFNGDIPQDLLDHPEHWSWYQNYGDYIAYNTGSLENADGQYLECGGRNVWDEQWELGGINEETGTNYSANDRLRSKNYIRVLPNATYYFKTPKGVQIIYYNKNKDFVSSSSWFSQGTFNIPSNVSYIRFNIINTYGTTYNHDITISLYYATGDSYDQYFPYEQPKVYDTGTEVLRKAGSVKDTKAPDGTITRNVGYVDLGTLTWDLYDSSGVWYSNAISGIKTTSSDNDIPNISSTYYVRDTRNAVISKTQLNIIGMTTGGRLYIYNGSSSNQPSGNAYYELAEPTTEQGTPFSENIEINDYGTMGWLDTNNAYVDIPQGCKIFYPAWYVGFIDSLGQREDIEWSADNVVSQSELSASETKRDTVDTQLKNAIGGTLRQLLAVSKSIDFNNTAWIDLGTLSWSVYSGNANTRIAPLDVNANRDFNSNYLSTNGYSIGYQEQIDTIYVNVGTSDTSVNPTGLLAYEKASS